MLDYLNPNWHLHRAVKRGIQLIVIDPRRTETALAQDAPHQAQAAAPEEDAEAQPAPTHRRMRFHFASDLAQDMEGSSA